MKKLIFCFDGTCNSPEDSSDFFEDTSISNILKLHAFFGGKLNPENGINTKLKGQQSFYYSGVGTRGNWLKRKFNAMFSPPYGDMDDILDKAKADLDANFVIGDCIYIFGFSRGAAIARMFAAHLPYKVKFLGVFDTVAATRGSLDLNPNTYPASGIVFENGTLGAHVEKAVHLLSLDEKRILFQPTLFNYDSRVSEVWFAGVHSDIGGSYWFDGLSDITLQYMLTCVEKELVIIKVKDIDYEGLKIAGSQDMICIDDLNIKPLVTGTLHTQMRTNTNSVTLSPRLVRVNVNDVISDHAPIIHHSVAERFAKVSEYRPYALRNLNFKLIDEKGETTDMPKGISSLG
jgi:pimeloyl-ACP methyl ester carboxylesterase